MSLPTICRPEGESLDNTRPATHEGIQDPFPLAGKRADDFTGDFWVKTGRIPVEAMRTSRYMGSRG